MNTGERRGHLMRWFRQFMTTHGLKDAHPPQLGTIRLDGRGIAAVRAVLADYSTMLETLSERTMTECHRLTERRIYDIQAGKRQAHDVEIMKL